MGPSQAVRKRNWVWIVSGLCVVLLIAGVTAAFKSKSPDELDFLAPYIKAEQIAYSSTSTSQVVSTRTVELRGKTDAEFLRMIAAHFASREGWKGGEYIGSAIYLSTSGPFRKWEVSGRGYRAKRWPLVKRSLAGGSTGLVDARNVGDHFEVRLTEDMSSVDVLLLRLRNWGRDPLQ